MNLPPIYLLQTLAAFHEYGTVAKAATHLNSTQPTVTRQLQQLESWSKSPLFETDGRKKVLTDHGRILAEAFSKRFEDFKVELQQSQQRLIPSTEQTIRICADREILGQHFIQHDFPGRLELVPSTEAEIENEISAESADIAVTSSQIDTVHYSLRRLFSTRAILLIPKRWSREVPSFREAVRICERHPLCTFSHEEPYVQRFIEAFRVQKRPVVRVLVDDWSVVEERVHHQLAWALVPSEFAREARGYWRLEMPESVGTQAVFIYTRKSLTRLSWFKSFISEVIA